MSRLPDDGMMRNKCCKSSAGDGLVANNNTISDKNKGKKSNDDDDDADMFFEAKNEWEGNIYIYKGGKINQDDKENLKHVLVHESVSIIPEKAFAYCTNLKSVEFSTTTTNNDNNNNDNKLMKIGHASFCGCHNLSSIINLQYTQVEIIESRSFSHCTMLTTIQFPASVQHIGRLCFYACSQLKVLDVSHATHADTTTEEGIFGYCSALTTVNLPPATWRIGTENFRCCHALETLDLRTTCIIDIEESAFICCDNLATIYFPTTTRTIASNSFRDCTKLTSLNLQTTSIESIGDRAFQNCYDLKTINFPKTLRCIGHSCFHCCTKVAYLNLYQTSIEKIGHHAFNNCTSLMTVVGISMVQQEEEKIMSDEKSFCHHDPVNLPATLVEIGKNAFSSCPELMNSIDNNLIQYECDINRGGRRFLHRDHRHHDNGDANDKYVGKVYHSSLWPLILYRVMNTMVVPKQRICPNGDRLSSYTYGDPFRRRVSVAFYLLVQGVTGDLQSSSENIRTPNVTQKQSLFSGLIKKRKAD